MAATEIEDLAALVGIEILPDGSSEDTKQQQCSRLEDTAVSSHEEVTDTNTQSVGANSESEATQSGDASSSLEELQEEFSSRYTQDDAEFVHTLATFTQPPPCVTPWWLNDRGGGDRSRGRGRQNWGRGRGWDRDQGDRRDRDFHQRPHGHHDSRHRSYYQEDRRRQHDFYRDRERSPMGRDRRW